MNARREFLKKVGLAGMMVGSGSILSREMEASREQILLLNERKFGLQDRIRVGFIGCGIQGFDNIRSALSIPGVEIAAACDLYNGRLDRVKELYGKHIYTTRDYRDLLDRPDIDAVCISTSDHWHDHMTIAALAKGIPVYCEKPMVHRLEEGLAVIEAERKSNGVPLQIGSQRGSALSVWKAKELISQGAIGDIIMADIRYDRNTSNGAWQYSIPLDATAEQIDWDAFIGDAPRMRFDPVRFFRWRNYIDYGTGVAGDLFVHLFTSLHIIMDSLGPDRIVSSGGLRFWKDGRDVPDVMLALYDYPDTKTHPAFNVQIRSNFVDGSGGATHVQLIGTEGMMTVGWSSIELKRNKISRRPSYGGWDSFDTFTAAQQKEYEQWFKSTYPPDKLEVYEPGVRVFHEPQGYDSNVDHWAHFIDAILNGTKLVEDSAFGLRAAGPSIAANLSYFKNDIVNWDPIKMIIKH